MKSAEYWGKRSTQIAQRQFKKADEYAAALRKEYNRAILSIKKDVEVFYQRFADNNGIVDMAEARRQLNSKELEEFRWTLEDFTAKAKNNADGQWTKQLDNAYFRTRVSRLEALQLQINHHVEMLAGSKQQGVKGLLGDAYTDTYYRTLFELQKGTGIGASFARVDQQGLEVVLGTKLDGKNWSQRIWDDRSKLRQELHTKLSQSLIRGDSLDKTTQDLAKRMDVSYSNTYRLVQAETAFFTEQATMESYRQSGFIDEYEFLATLEVKTKSGGTCEICQALDGKVFKVSEQEVGINSPPIHPHCRCTTAPRFNDEENVGERIARDPKTRKTYNVPGDIDYPEWYEKYVEEEVKAANKTEAVSIKDQNKFAQTYSTWSQSKSNDVEEFAKQMLKDAGIDLPVQRHPLKNANGQCMMRYSDPKQMEVLSYELNSLDQRAIDYQIKTSFHEAFHAKADGLPHDANSLGFERWAYIDDVFAEVTSHYLTKSVGITMDITPTYAQHLVETLPKLKKLNEFKKCSTLADFGEVAYEYRFGTKLNAKWGPFDSFLKQQKHDIMDYSKAYIAYMEKNSPDLIDALLENMGPSYQQYRQNMIADLSDAVQNVKSFDKIMDDPYGNKKFTFTNALIITMNKLGVK